MPTRDSSEPAESKNGSGEDNSQSGESSSNPLKFGVMKRTRMMGTSGLAAASIGWVLVGCTAFGFGVGLFLDRQFGTGYWMPVMVMVGIAAGFREMFRTLAQLNKQPPPPRKERSQSTLSAATTVRDDGAERAVSEQSTWVEEKEKPRRIFEVPPPPTASFDRTPAKQSEPQQKLNDDPESLIRKLLGEAENGDDKASDKPT